MKPLERYALILDILSRHPAGLSLTELADFAQLPKGTAHRIMKALSEIGYVAGGNGRTSYVLGPRLMRMLHLGRPPTWVAPLVEPVLQALMQEFGETAFLAKLVGNEVHSVTMVVPNPTERSYVHPGRVMPANAAASAKAIIAFQGDKTINEMIKHHPLARYTPKTCTKPAQLKRQFAQIKTLGYALCVDELDPGVMSIATPVHAEGVGVIYSIGLVGLEPRLSKFPNRNLVAGLRTASETVARLLRTREAASRSTESRQSAQQS
jgi:DNA-binding IclR family transcriptional regulator